VTPLRIEDDGFTQLIVTPRKPDAKTVTIELDTFAVYNTLAALRRKEYADADAEGRAPTPAEVCRDWLNKEYGLGCSAGWAFNLYTALGAEVERIEKKDLSTASAVTQEPTASPSGRTDQRDTPPA
jgi:hypothetical protein